ncbi:MAG: hypothetical protein JXB07_18415 [Anaerolineae bacterium]|nr:hypothetical protein [Anaerolineae bacterium]
MTDDANFEDMPLEVLAETESYAILLGQDMEGEPVYNIELGSITLHLFEDEWSELVELIGKVPR